MSGIVGMMSTISRDSKGAMTTTQRFGDGTVKLHQFGGFSDHLAPWERFHNLAEQRARRGRGAWCRDR